MNNIFGYTDEEINSRNMKYTVNEIYRQTKVWKSIYEKIENRREEIETFLKKLDGNTRVIFTGAGSSGFVGDSLAPIVRKDFNYKDVESIHTTDIVGAPYQYLKKDVKTVLISFGRSGDSPESIAAVDAANKVIDDVYHIIITCNPNGKLAGYKGNKTLNLVFEEIEDKGFAMTSSVTGMMLAAYSVFAIGKDLKEKVNILSIYAENIINNEYETIRDNYKENADRLVVLGAGNLFGAARESALKNIELTAGKIISWYDTPMGFRHGPKSMLNKNTLILFYVSNDEYTRKYDIDMLKELSEAVRFKLVVVSDKYYEEAEKYSDVYLYNSRDNALEDAFTPYIPILTAQIFALFASLKLGCTPDNPFPSGEVNRVVKGVSIHSL